jgi:beta-glucosidase
MGTTPHGRHSGTSWRVLAVLRHPMALRFRMSRPVALTALVALLAAGSVPLLLHLAKHTANGARATNTLGNSAAGAAGTLTRSTTGPAAAHPKAGTRKGGSPAAGDASAKPRPSGGAMKAAAARPSTTPTTESPARLSAGPAEVSLAANFDNVGITDNSTMTAGDIDGAGSSFSAQALAADSTSPGATVSYHGVSFAWPDVAPGSDDNVVAGGQAIGVTGSGSTLAFLVAASYGPASGTGRVAYSDGSSQQFTIGAPDWYQGCSSGAPDVVLYTPYRNRASGQSSDQVCVYYVSAPLQAGKTVTSITLPDVSAGVAVHSPALHIFAATIN